MSACVLLFPAPAFAAGIWSGLPFTTAKTLSSDSYVRGDYLVTSENYNGTNLTISGSVYDRRAEGWKVCLRLQVDYNYDPNGYRHAKVYCDEVSGRRTFTYTAPYFGCCGFVSTPAKVKITLYADKPLANDPSREDVYNRS
ncbi:MAG: hypothetical protein AABM66_07215 [Actinomycetota bacterium]